MSIQSLRNQFDAIIDWGKWPTVLLSFLSLPIWIITAFLVIKTAILQPVFSWLALGGLIYTAFWWYMFRKPIWGSFFSTFEHELTHAIFAWATLHKVTGLKATWREGGEVRYVGNGNWLISIAPYFFPTISVFAVIATLFVPENYHLLTMVILGVTISYHVTSTIRETHPQQTDLQKVGFIASFLFIPSASIATFIMCIAVAVFGLSGLGVVTDAFVEATNFLIDLWPK